MKSIYRDYLFAHNILVCSEQAPADIAYASAFLLDRCFAVQITEGRELVTADMIEYTASQLGKDVPEPFYRGFPDSVRELTPDALLFDQALHYLRTYGFGDFSEAGHSLLETVAERKAFDELVEIKEFTVLTEQTAFEKLASYADDLLKSTRPLNDTRYAFVKEYLLDTDNFPERIASKNLTVKLLMDTRDIRFAKFLYLSDVIKLVDEMQFALYGSDNIKKLNLCNQDRKFITRVINRLFEEDRCNLTECYEKQALWCGLLHHLHYKAVNETAEQFVTAMRTKGNASLYSEYETALGQHAVIEAANILKTGKGNGALLRSFDALLRRCRTEEEVDRLLSMIDAENSIVLLQLLMKYSLSDENGSRTYTFTRHNMMKVHHKKVNAADLNENAMIGSAVLEQVKNVLKEKLAHLYQNKLGKVYIDAKMDKYALPIQECAASGGFATLPKGTRKSLPETAVLRAFTYWEKVHDIDLSVIGIDDKGNQTEFSWRTMGSRQSAALTYSGDQTSGYYGGSEFFDVNLGLIKKEYPAIKYLVFCNNVYSAGRFDSCVCRAGYMLRSENSTGEVFEPKTVKTAFVVNCHSDFAYLFAIDLEENDLIWLNIGNEEQRSVAGTAQMSFLTRYFDVTSVMSIGDFFRMLAAEIVDTPEEAEVIVSDSFLEAAEGVEVIRSSDIERILALMNA